MRSADSLFKYRLGSSKICYARREPPSKKACTGRSRWNNLPVGHFEWQHPGAILSWRGVTGG
jgi:hypothetical protein